MILKDLKKAVKNADTTQTEFGIQFVGIPTQ